jgi:MarR family transcriptional regulator, transcriptional regulator for hemolysin
VFEVFGASGHMAAPHPTLKPMAQRKPLSTAKQYEDPLNSFGYLFRIAFRSFSRALERRTLPFGVSSGQWRFLRVLWNEDGLTQIELSRRVGMREPTTVAAVNGLERAGYVERRKSATDRRKIHVHLTARARRLKDKLMPYVAEVNEIGMKGLTPQETALIRQALLKVIDNLGLDDGNSYRDARVRSGYTEE